MKYQSLVTFEKHLQEAFPSHFAPVYMVVCGCDFERKKIIEKILNYFRKKDPSLTISYFDAAEVAVELVLQELNAQSLFGSSSLVVCDKADKLKESEKLVRYLEVPNRSSYLILSASTMKPVSQLYLKGKKEMVVMDLSEEKPWDKKKRLHDWLIGEAKLAKKTLGSDVASYLLDSMGFDVASLSQEMSKLICYAGDKTPITLSDVKAISTGQSTLTGWQLAEGVVWGSESVEAEKSGDLGFLLMFIGQLRYQLQTGYQIAHYVDQPAEAGRLFPNLRPQILDKYLAGARKKRAAYFHRGLLALFEFELAAKSSNTDLSLLFDRFIAKLRI